MAVIFADGFNHYYNTELADKWDFVNTFVAPPTIGVGLGRWGSNCIKFADSWQFVSQYVVILDGASITCGAAVDIGAGLTERFDLFRFVRSGTELCRVGINTNGRVYVYVSGSPGLSTEITPPLSTDCYTYIEVQLTFHATLGQVIIKIQEEEKLNQDELDLGGYGCDRVNIGTSTFIRQEYLRAVYVDDVYILDDSGPTNNDFLGDITVEEQLPISDGTYQEFTPSAGNDHYALVDDPYNAVDENTFVTERNNGTRDTYNFPNLGAEVGEVVAVGMTYYVQKTSSGTRELTALARLGGVDGNNATAINVPAGFAYHQSWMDYDPNNNNWTIANVNNSEWGQEITG